MYTIQRNNKRFNNKVFTTYEAARSYVRKWLRLRFFINEVYNNANAAIKDFGFGIKKQAI